MTHDTTYFDASNNENCLENCGGLRDAFDIVKATIVGVIALLIILGNSFCLLVLWRTKDIPVVARLFMASLTATDLAFGLLVVVPVTVSSAFNRWPVNHHAVCHLHEATTSVLGGALTMCFLGISIDRLIAVCRPLKYPSLVTEKRALLVIILLWLLPCLFRVIIKLAVGYYELEFRSDTDMCWVRAREPGHTMYTVGVVLFTMVPFLATCGVYARLFLIARRHARRIAAVPNQMPRNADSEVSKMHVKSAITFLLITTTFGMCWIPFVGIWFHREFTNGSINEYVIVLFELMLFSNSWLNCLVYHFRSKVFRRAARETLRGWCFFLKVNTARATREQTVGSIRVSDTHELDRSTTV